MTAPRPWSTQPITGAQHRAWLAEEEVTNVRTDWYARRWARLRGPVFGDDRLTLTDDNGKEIPAHVVSSTTWESP